MEELLAQDGIAAVSESNLAFQPNREEEKRAVPRPPDPPKTGEVASDLGVSFGTAAGTVKVVSPNRRLGYRFGKRLFDIVFSFLAMIFLSPVYLITALAIFLDDPGPILFFQDRDGLNNIPFKMWKFRSMCKDAPKLRASMESQNEMDGPTFKLRNDPRVTRVGKFIRRTSIDELPQLVNILRGQMTFVGPRPLATYETKNFTEEQKQRHLVKPGLVCYWQVSGRNKVSFEDWMKMDLRYIEEASFQTDLKILLLAVPAVLKRDGAM